jgi:hypothetical protein
MVRTQIQIEKGQVKWLKRHALAKGVSMAQLIRDSIDFYRGHVEKQQLISKKKKNALAAVGSFSSNER